MDVDPEYVIILDIRSSYFEMIFFLLLLELFLFVQSFRLKWDKVIEIVKEK